MRTSRFFISFLISFSLFTQLSVADESGEEDLNLQTREIYFNLVEQSPSTKDSLDATERQSLLNAVSNNPVAKLSMVGHYDPDGLTGFCFGRAMTAHLMARQRGLSESAIRKLFIVGDLRRGDTPEWRFHVTTLVRGTEDGKLYAIDPIMRPPLAFGTPLPAETWIQIVRRTWDKQNKAHLYLTDPHVVTPDMTVFPVTPQDETGERIIDLSFDPSTKVGIETIDLQGQVAFAPDLRAEEQYLIRVEEAEPFHFLKMLMKILNQGEESEYLFDFRNYFPDLMASLTAEAEVPGETAENALARFAPPALPMSALMERDLIEDPFDLHGMRVPVAAAQR